MSNLGDGLAYRNSVILELHEAGLILARQLTVGHRRRGKDLLHR